VIKVTVCNKSTLE